MAKIGVRARAVDLLGRQQIAGIPTAIHELFKNAHDAYAERVEVDYFRKQRIMVLRDDGYGMTRADVENRWLTLGTESRVGANSDDAVWTGPKKLPRRPMMGEKGIGRLAIAAIAPITLLLTRAVREDGVSDLVVCLVHWGLFEQPGLEVQQIDVPIAEFKDGALPNREDIDKLVADIRKNLEVLRPQLGKGKYEELSETLDQITVDPAAFDLLLEKQAKERDPEAKTFSLRDGGYGTQFIMLPTAPELNSDIDGDRTGDEEATPLQRNLLGFSNSMEADVPPIAANFRDHQIDGSVPDHIARGMFFTNRELRDCDQYVEGEIDEFGQFKGTVRIYDNEPVRFICNWPGAKGRLTKCGPFSFKFGYLMGWERESLLDQGEYKSLRDKCEALGGIYMYRDGIRILPYGNSDFDFLDVERKRAKSAKDAFFSFRRMVGYAAVSHETNPSLQEKAGREGFRQNQAYRDFRQILMNLLDRLAIEFFRRGGDQSDLFWAVKDRVDAEFKAAQNQRKRVEEQRKNLADHLNNFFSSYENEEYSKDAAELEAKYLNLINHIDAAADPTEYAETLNRHRIEFYRSMRDLEASARVTKPASLPIKGALSKDWARYGVLISDLQENVFAPVKDKISASLQEAGRKIDDVYRSVQASAALQNKSNELVKEVAAIRNEAYQATEAFKRALRDTFKLEFSKFKSEMMDGVEKFTRDAVNRPDDIERLYAEFQNRFEQINKEQLLHFSSVRDQMLSLIEDLKSGYTADTRAFVWEQRAEQLQEQVEFYEEYAQMGMGLGILQHEFDHVASDLRSAIHEIQPWARRNDGLLRIYNRLRTSFETLDNYLKIIDPIGRKMRTGSVELTGEMILIYLHRLFKKRIDENEIRFDPSAAFLKHSITARSSVVLGAFTNIVDNAIYWLINEGEGSKCVTFDADAEGFLIENNGPGIRAKDVDRIFEFGESDKSGGKGIGLSISRSTLRAEGFDLTLVKSGENVGPVFKIHTDPREET